ncbi:MAG: sugar ABC transporter permease [Actinomycetota bacterium]|nr:sugar ABC transporter permease [Actinomycetota bacterium]
MKRFLSNKNNYGYFFIIPFFIFFIVLQLYPLIYTLFLSFTNLSTANPQGDFVGLSNYIRLAQDNFFRLSLKNTWRIWIVCFIPQLIFALLLATILTRSKIKGKDVFRGVYFLPNLVTAASIGILFNVLLGWQSGAINQILVALRIITEDQKIHFLASPFWTSTAVSAILWWMWFGHSMILFMAAMVAVPQTYYDAAAVDGANAWQSFWKITVPQIKPVMIYVLVTSLIGGMNNFDIPFVIGEGQNLGTGGPLKSILTMVMYLYNMAFTGGRQRGYAAAIAFAIFFIVIICSVIIFRLMSREEES